MNIPKDYNTRAEAMWRIISQRVDFRKKSVVDLGCGHGEMLWRCYLTGTTRVWGIDLKEGVLGSLRQKPIFKDVTNEIQVSPLDIEKERHLIEAQVIDIAICFSVLPYLDDPKGFTTWMANTFPECLIEAQYEPEPYNIGVSNDDEMYVWLRDCGFEVAVPLGKTEIEIRNTTRSIWYCSREKKPLGLK